MKKNDWFLAAGVIFAALAFMLFNYFVIHSDGAKVIVSIDGNEYGSYMLSEEQDIDINGTNLLVIRDGKADMTQADCPDKLCVHQKAVSKEGETIVCLPNKVVVEVTGADESELDSIAN